MNILALTSAYPHPDDGNEVVTPTVKYFCEKWAEQGHNVIVIHNSSCFPRFFYFISEKNRQRLSSRLGHTLPTNASRIHIEYEKNRVLVKRLPIVKLVPHGRFSPKSINEQLKRINDCLTTRNFVPDIIIGHWVNPQIELIEALSKKYPKAKTSLVFHDDCTYININRYNLISCIRKLSAVGCRNKSYSEYIQRALSLSKPPFICYSGIPDKLADRCEMGLRDRKFSDTDEYVYVGRLVKYKKVDTIIEALHQVYLDRPFRFHIIGSGAEKEKLWKLVKKNEMEDKVIFHGQLPREKVFELMQKCTFFIMVSEHETFGMVYIEAMLAGCITIAAKDGGADGIIRDKENGFLSSEGNVNELVEKIRVIQCMDRKQKELIRKDAIKTALKFRDKLMAERYLTAVTSWRDNE